MNIKEVLCKFNCEITKLQIANRNFLIGLKKIFPVIENKVLKL